MTARLCLVAALAASLLGACGAQGDETAVRNAVDTWMVAVASHHDAEACARLSSELRTRIERHLLGEGTKGNCDTWAARWVSPRHPASHRDAHITATQIRGAHATVTLVARGVPTGSVRLVQENGRWLIDNF
jgi:anti-sigma-K factor RskA